jgi:uncharacterized protein YdeI (YjbR/CyaY-like superfamily)
VPPKFFEGADGFRLWLAKNHDKKTELVLGFHKKHTGKPSITYQEALDLALCYGWIDGIRRTIDGESYTIRFTPRRPTSVWSLVNIKRVGELKRLGLMKPPGLAAFKHCDEKKAAQYSYERKTSELDAGARRRFQSNKQAWAFFEAQPHSYKRVANWFVMSAKKEETRLSRLEKVIEASQKGQRLGELTGKAKRKE